MKKECYLFRGLPGTGKTSTSKLLSEILKIECLSTDEVRKSGEIFFEGSIYEESNKKRVYKRIEEMLSESLKQGIPKILDGTYSKVRRIERIKKICDEFKYDLKIIECVCNENIIKKRLLMRKKTLSDANLEVYNKIKKEYEIIEDKFRVYLLNTEQNIQRIRTLLEEIVND